MKTQNLNSTMLHEISSLISHLPVAVFVVNKNGEIISCNENWVNATGLNAEEFKPIKAKEIFGNEFSEKVNQMVHEIFSGKKPEDMTVAMVNQNDQKEVFFKISGNLFQKKYGVFSAIDVSENINLQQTLLEKKKQFFSIINTLGDAVWKLDIHGNYKNNLSNKVSHLFPDMIGIEGNSLRDNFPEEVVKLFLKTIEKAITTEQMIDLEFSISHDQEEKWCLAKITPIHSSEEGKIEEVLVMLRDNTEEKKNRQQIEYKNQLIQQLTSINNGPVLHIIEDGNLNFNFISGDITSLTGYSFQELDQMNWVDIVYENDREYLRKNLRKLFLPNNETHLNSVYRIKTKEGKLAWITDHLSVFKNDGKEMLFGVMLNVTEIQLLNNKLKQRDRILTKSGLVAKIGGWEHDLKSRETILTDGIFDIYEVGRTTLNKDEAVSYYIKDHQPIIRKHIEDLMKNGKGFELDLQIKTGKGNLKWVKCVGTAEWHHGKFTKIYGILQDITEKKENELVLQESEKRFNAAFELAPIGIGLVSPQGQWIKVNLALSRFFEYSKEELKNIPLMKLKFMEDLNNALKLAKKTHNKKLGIYQLEKKYLTQRGKVKWGNVIINIVNNEKNSPAYAIIQIVDITKNKKFEKELIIAKKEADEANKAKSNFLSSMSHEIRTPLNGVIGITNLLVEEIKESQLREKLEALKFSSDSLLLIVNDILDYSKIKSGVLTLESNPFVLKRLVEAVKETNIQKAKELGNQIVIHYDSNLPEKLMGDQLRLGQILNNLVNNAVKFTKNGTIQITIKKIGQSNGWHNLLFSVKDNGIGIPKNAQAVIFDQFIQAESGITRKFGGTGLGLSIVKGLLKAMSSDIVLESKLGRGTEISFQLLLKSAKTDQESTDVNLIIKNKDLQHKTILLVEDNPVNTMVVSDYIKKWKGETILAENGVEAIEKFLKNMDKIALILMDLQMPVMNGFDATEQIKKIKPDVPILAMTASIGDKSKLDAYDFGMAAYVIKPFFPNEFYNTIKAHIL